MEQFKNLTDSQTARQDDNNIIETTGFNKKTDKKQIKFIVLCAIKVIVAVGLFGALLLAVYVVFVLYSKEENKQFIPEIIKWFTSAFSGVGLLYVCKQLAKWFKN